MAKKKDVMEEVLAFLASRGVETSNLPTEQDKYNYKNEDAAVVFANKPLGFAPGICIECKKPFAHNKVIPIGSAVGFCSDPCRRDNWTRTTGLPYKAISTKDVWDGDPPLVVSPEQMKRLQGIADWFNKNRTSLVLVAESNSEEPEPEVQTLPEPQKYSHQGTAHNSQVVEEAMKSRDSHTNPQPLLSDEVLSQMSEEEDLFGFS